MINGCVYLFLNAMTYGGSQRNIAQIENQKLEII